MAEKRLIDANVLSDKVAESKHNNPHQQGMVRVNHRNEHDHFLRMISIAPTVDAVEVVHAKWVYKPDGFVCSNCDGDIPQKVNFCRGCYMDTDDVFSNFCPNCGADMRESESDGC